MKTTHLIGILIGLLIGLIALLVYIVIEEAETNRTFHTVIIKGQEETYEKINYIYNSLSEFDITCLEN